MAGTGSEIMYLKGVGPKRAEVLSKELGISSLMDLLQVYPFRYVDRSSFVKIRDINSSSSLIQVRAFVYGIELFDAKGPVFTRSFAQGARQVPDLPSDFKWNTVKRMRVLISDETGIFETVYFKGIKWTYLKIHHGGEFVFFGKPTVFSGSYNMVHPDIEQASGKSADPAGKIVGVYPSTEKLKNAGITNNVMGKIMSSAWDAAGDSIQETLPEYILKDLGLMGLKAALYNIHFPKNPSAAEQAAYRLKFEELFFLQLSLLKQKYVNTRLSKGIVLNRVGDGFNKCYNALPYSLTGAQKRVIKEIREDLMSGRQMNRLLQGDVGSGKTMVAVLSSLLAVDSGYQACIMAPTEVLAQQHYRNICKYLAPTGIKAALLTGSSKTKERREIHEGLEDGSIGIIVGTHALLEDNVIFKNLALAIIDEQHRFGVQQRAKLWSKGSGGMAPHVLVMTATPIPRTLAMTLYGDLDVSVIDEMPPGRQPVQTIHATEGKRTAMFNFLKDQIKTGRQVFIVYPLIYESEKLDYKTLEEGYDLITQVFPWPEYSTSIVHGQMSNEDKNRNMDAFAKGHTNILVATSVIEVGVDVPNASVMVIESAERFGLSQLHQLRGRVGRGSAKSFCILMSDVKLSADAKKKLEIMCATENGFVIAEEDMKLRGPGDLEGTAQSGLPIELKIASLARDGEILSRAKSYADRILSADPTLSAAVNLPLAQEIRKDKYATRNFSKIS